METATTPSYSDGPGAAEAAGGVTRRLWQHAFGEMLIETRPDGSVWVNGSAVADTLPDRGRGAAPTSETPPAAPENEPLPAAPASQPMPTVPADDASPAVPARE